MDGKIVIGTELDTKSFEKEIASLEAKLSDIEASLQMAKEDKTLFSTSEIREMEKEAEKLSNKLVDLRKKQSEIGKTDLSGINSTLSNIGNSVENVTKKVGKWALAVFGIRSAYMFVRQAMSTLTQYNEQMATDVEYIRYLLATTLQPVIETLIKLAYKLLTYVGYIAKAWFGVNIFANASVDAFNKSKKAIAGTNKQAKELQKTLTGFDEMNILQENGTTTTGGGGGGIGTINLPQFASMEDVEKPGWIKWIADNGKLILGIIGGIVAGIAAFRFETALASAEIIEKAKAIEAVGIGAIIMGVIFLVQDIIDMIKDPSWENFIAILGDIAIVIGGIMLLLGNWWGLLVVGAGLVVKLVAENWDKIKEILGKVGSWIYDNIIEPVGEFFKGLWDSIVNGFNTSINWIKSTFTNVVNFFKNIINTIVNLFKTIGTKVGDAVGSAFKAVINGVLTAIENILNTPINTINGLIDTINIIPGVNLGKLPTFKLPRLAKGGIINMPGRGVNYNGANIGEQRPEAIVPFTDSQQMELLGASIGKYITVAPTIPVYVGNRMVAREIRRINSEDDFAYNR